MKAGACASVTIMSKLAVVVLPAESVAVYVTVVVPNSKMEPLATSGPLLLIWQLSVIVGSVQVTSALH